MNRSVLILGLAVALAFPCLQLAADSPTLPETPKKPVTDIYHNVKITDDYRWLEKAGDPAVLKWIEAQNKVSRAFFDKRSSLKPIRERLRQLLVIQPSSYQALQHRPGHLLALYSSPKQEQPTLVWLPSADEPGSAKTVVDPNVLDVKGKTTIDFFVASRDGKTVAISLSENGSEQGTLNVYDVATGKNLPATIPPAICPTPG